MVQASIEGNSSFDSLQLGSEPTRRNQVSTSWSILDKIGLRVQAASNYLANVSAQVVGRIVAPVATQVATPVAAPVASPVASPVAEPVAEPVAAPVAAPIAASVATPEAEPLAPPFELDEEAGTTRDVNPQLTREGIGKTKIVLKDCRVVLAE